jgi:hypothetical protein
MADSGGLSFSIGGKFISFGLRRRSAGGDVHACGNLPEKYFRQVALAVLVRAGFRTLEAKVRGIPSPLFCTLFGESTVNMRVCAIAKCTVCEFGLYSK